MRIEVQNTYKMLSLETPMYNDIHDSIKINSKELADLYIDPQASDPLTNKSFSELINSNINENLDYVIARVESAKKQSFMDGCSLTKNYLGLSHEMNPADIDSASFYHLDISNEKPQFEYLCNLSELDDTNIKKQFFLTYLSSCDPNVSEQKQAEDQFAVGLWYQKQKEMNKSFRWYINAASNGSSDAFTRIAKIFDKGLGDIKPSKNIAFKCWLKAAQLAPSTKAPNLWEMVLLNYQLGYGTIDDRTTAKNICRDNFFSNINTCLKSSK